ncbi:hypothetical protein KSS87_003910, partial [Heliosperma pusillum]
FGSSRLSFEVVRVNPFGSSRLFFEVVKVNPFRSSRLTFEVNHAMNLARRLQEEHVNTFRRKSKYFEHRNRE